MFGHEGNSLNEFVQWCMGFKQELTQVHQPDYIIYRPDIHGQLCQVVLQHHLAGFLSRIRNRAGNHIHPRPQAIANLQESELNNLIEEFIFFSGD